jgi:predicted anti-sigma-YlaC factor YlaD
MLAHFTEVTISAAAMNHLERVRNILPILAALYAMVMVANTHAAPRPMLPAASSIDAERVVSGLKWHMLEIARNEQNEAILFPGN